MYFFIQRYETKLTSLLNKMTMMKFFVKGITLRLVNCLCEHSWFTTTFTKKIMFFFSYECRWAWWFHCCVAAATLASWAWTLAESLWHLPTKILLLADIVGFRKTTFWAKALMEFHISMFSYCTNTKKNEIYVFS